MKTTLENVDPTTVTLTVEVEPERVRKAFDAAAKELAKQVSIKGFRPGKAPRRLIEQRLGEGAVAQQALEPSINEFYGEALEEVELAPVAMPEIDVENIVFDEDEGCRFTATIQVRPEFDPPEHTGIGVTHPEWDVDDDAIDAELQELRERFAEVDVVERAAAKGDYVTIDLTFSVEGEVQEDQAVEDAMYEVGSQGVTPKLDDELVGASAGDELVYTDELPEDYPELGGKEAEFTVSVKDVRAKTLPELDDDFAITASEHDTIAELHDGIRKDLLRRSISEARHGARGRVLEAYLALVDVPLPQAMVDNEVQTRVHQVEHQAQRFGVEPEQLYEMQGTTAEEFEEQARTEATNSVKAQLVLDELAEKLGLDVTDQDVSNEIVRHAQANDMQPQQVAEIIQQQGSVGALVGDVLRRKAIDAIMDAAELEGAPPQDLLVELGLAPGEDDEPVDEAAAARAAAAQAEAEQAAAVAQEVLEQDDDSSDTSDASDDSSDAGSGDEEE